MPKEIQAKVIVASGKAGDEIVRFADEGKVDLIVIASRDETGGRHYIFGIVTEKTAQFIEQPSAGARGMASLGSPQK